MQRFSENLVEDREFEVGGELFKWRYPFWEEVAALFDGDVADVKNGDGKVLTAKENIEEFQKRIPIFLDPDNDALNRWKALVKRKENPVPHWMYGQIYIWLLEVTSGRPTTTPSPSATGDGPTADTSKEK